MTIQQHPSSHFTQQLTVRVPEALQMLGIGRTKFYALLGEGEIEAIKIGKATLVVVESLYAFVERRRFSRGEGV
ncbi:MAG: helix-turn-helix transcriptional regulator [Sphingobium sp.]